MKLCSIRNGSSVSTAVNERGEGTVVAVIHFHFMTACYYCMPQHPVKVDGSLFHQTIKGAKVRFFFSIFTTRPSVSLFFYAFTTRPSISSLSQRPTGYESRRFSCQCRVKY